LRRASAFLITHTELADPDGPVDTLLEHNFDALAYRCRHVQTAYLDVRGSPVPAEAIGAKTVLAFCGIGNPAAFFQKGCLTVQFGDHHEYSARDLEMLSQRARQANAVLLLTTEKDWVKLESLVGQVPDLPPIVRVQLEIRFEADDERRLINQITKAIDSSPARIAGPGEPIAGSSGRGGGGG
jgi:tetraacyldisaccharide-1-P 4'-kinase